MSNLTKEEVDHWDRLIDKFKRRQRRKERWAAIMRPVSSFLARFKKSTKRI